MKNILHMNTENNHFRYYTCLEKFRTTLHVKEARRMISTVYIIPNLELTQITN
jgi:hypothetical protein